MSGGRKVEILEDLRGFDPELEKLLGKERIIRIWSDADLDTLSRYYGKVDMRILAKQLNRTVSAIQNKASKRELTKRAI